MSKLQAKPFRARPVVACCEPRALDACILGVELNDAGVPNLAYDLRASVIALKATGMPINKALAVIATQANQTGVTFVARPEREPKVEGTLTVVRNQAGECLAVTRVDEDHKILSVIWTRRGNAALTGVPR